MTVEAFELVELVAEYGDLSKFAQAMSLVDDVNRIASLAAALATLDIPRPEKRKRGEKKPRGEKPAPRPHEVIRHWLPHPAGRHMLAELSTSPSAIPWRTPSPFTLLLLNEIGIFHDPRIIDEMYADWGGGMRALGKLLAVKFQSHWHGFSITNPSLAYTKMDAARRVAQELSFFSHSDSLWKRRYYLDETLSGLASEFVWAMHEIEIPPSPQGQVRIVRAEMNSPLAIAFAITLGVIVAVPTYHVLSTVAFQTAAWRYVNAVVIRKEAEAQIRKEEAEIRSSDGRRAKALAELAEHLASAAADVGLEHPAKLLPAIQAIAQPLETAAYDLRERNISIQLSGKGSIYGSKDDKQG